MAWSIVIGTVCVYVECGNELFSFFMVKSGCAVSLVSVKRKESVNESEVYYVIFVEKKGVHWVVAFFFFFSRERIISAAIGKIGSLFVLRYVEKYIYLWILESQT